MSEITLNTIKDYPSKVLGDLLPGQMIAEAGSVNGCLNKITLSPLNRCYINSDYFIDPSGNKFVHFTTLDKAKEILSTNRLRLYDLNYADDPHEIVFTAKSVGLDSGIDLQRLKSWLHSISFCSYPLSEEDEHNMWRLYGNDGNGVGLVFSIHNDCSQWYNFHLSRIYYTKPEKIKSALVKHIDYFKRLNENGYSNSINEQNLVFNLLQLFAFHKHSIYGVENEFRLLYRHDSHWGLKKRVFTINRRNQLSAYVELELGHVQSGSFNIDDTKTSMPLMRIDKLILGYRYSDNDKTAIGDVMNCVFANNGENFMTRQPEIELTNLKTKFFS